MKPIADLSDDEFSHQVQRAVRSLPDAPAAWQQAATALFPATGLAAALGDAARALVAHVTAVLTFDSWAQPATALGVRGAGRTPTRHLLFSAQGHDIDLRIAPEAGGYALAGQVLGPDEHGQVELHLAPGAEAPSHRAALDAMGEFRIGGLHPGTYRVTLALGSRRIELPPVEVGEPAS